MTAQPTYCEDCDHVCAETRKKHPTQWLCILFPRLPGFSAVAPRAWVEAEPYMRCIGINGGHCRLYKKRPEGQRDNGL